jgi:hypothetical protein
MGRVLRCMSPELARFGRRKRTQQCLLLGKSGRGQGRYPTSANDPFRKWPKRYKIDADQGGWPASA